MMNKENMSMDQLLNEELRELLTAGDGQCVTIYLPGHNNPFEAREDPIRFRNLLKEAEERLIKGGSRAPAAREFLLPLHRLGDDPSLWQYQPNGLAIFFSTGLLRHYRLPLPFAEMVVVADRFHLKPLIPLFAEDHDFFVLAMSQKDIRLLQGNRLRAWELELEKVPRSKDEALQYDDPERLLQFKIKASVGEGGRGIAAFFSHGVGLDDASRKDDIRRYLAQVDKGLQEALKQESAPLVLAGVDYLLPLYRQVNTYPNLLEEGISGNPELLSADELHALTWPKVHAYFRKTGEEAIAQYRELAGKGRTSGELREILAAAHQGRVYKLLVVLGVQVWGNYSPEEGTLELHEEPAAGSGDLLDLAAIQTILNGGQVYIVERQLMPDDLPIAAVFRF